MFLIDCPHCGPRDQSEFHYGGEAHRTRPENPEAMSDVEWGDFLFMRKNPKGLHAERWRHEAGCGRWFNAVRSTATDRFLAVYPMGDPMPEGHADAVLHTPRTPSGEAAGSGNDAVKLVTPAIDDSHAADRPDLSPEAHGATAATT